MYPSMNHLPGFWDEANWADDKWEVYQARQNRPGAKIKEWFDQLGHRLMGKTMSRDKWKTREKKQWPSATGSYDHCVDHFNWLKGAGHNKEAKALKKQAKMRRPELFSQEDDV